VIITRKKYIHSPQKTEISTHKSEEYVKTFPGDRLVNIQVRKNKSAYHRKSSHSKAIHCKAF